MAAGTAASTLDARAARAARSPCRPGARVTPGYNRPAIAAAAIASLSLPRPSSALNDLVIIVQGFRGHASADRRYRYIY